MMVYLLYLVCVLINLPGMQEGKNFSYLCAGFISGLAAATFMTEFL